MCWFFCCNFAILLALQVKCCSFAGAVALADLTEALLLQRLPEWATKHKDQPKLFPAILLLVMASTDALEPVAGAQPVPKRGRPKVSAAKPAAAAAPGPAADTFAAASAASKQAPTFYIALMSHERLEYVGVEFVSAVSCEVVSFMEGSVLDLYLCYCFCLVAVIPFAVLSW